MRSTGTQNRVPEVPAHQLTRDRTLKHLRKLRWIGKEGEAQKILRVLDHKSAAIVPSYRLKRNHSGWMALRRTSPA
jgi:hypothetical protein